MKPIKIGFFISLSQMAQHLIQFKEEVEKYAEYDPDKNAVYKDFKRKMNEVKKRVFG